MKRPSNIVASFASRTVIFFATYAFIVFMCGAQELPFTYYTPTSELHPLPSATIDNLYQDNIGYIWMCVYGSGLVRYDGQTMELFTETDGLFGLTIMCALRDKTGRLWAASDMGVSVTEKPLHQYSIGERIRFTSSIGTQPLTHTSISQIAPNCLAMDSLGSVFVATTGLGVLRYRYTNKAGVHVDTLPTILPGKNSNATVYVLTATRGGYVYAGVDGGLMILNHSTQKFELHSLQPQLPKTSIHALAELSDGYLWIGYADGSVWKIDQQHTSPHSFLIDRSLKGIIYGIKEYCSGHIWITSYTSGILDFDMHNPQASKHYTRRNGLLSDNVRNPLVDREGNTWFTHTSGISKLQKNFNAFTLYTANSPDGNSLLPSSEITGIDVPKTTHSMMWLCTGAGITTISPDGKSETIGVEKGLSSNTTYDVHVDSKQRVWVGTFTGLDCFSFDRMKPPALRKGKSSTVMIHGKTAVHSFYDIGIIGVCNAFPMKQGGSSTAVHEALWFNSYRSVTCFVDEHWFIFNDQAGLPMSIMYALVVDSVGYVYVGTGDKGLYRTTEPLTIELLQQYIRDNNSMTGRTVHRSLFQPYWNTSLGASKDEIKELLWQNGTLWVGMTDAIVAFKDGNLNAKEVVQPANTSVAVEGYCGTYNPITKSLWFSFGKGLIEIDPATKRIIRSVTKENGLLSNEANWLEGIDADKNGMVYLAHPNGMSAYQPSLDQKNELEAPLVFRRAAYSEDSFGNNEFAVEYAALSFANERLVKYRTRLTGYDKLWSSEKTDSRIRYTNLSAFFFTKDYVFEVIACNNSGVWSTKPLQYRVTVFPPWWFRWWTFFIYLAGAFGIVRSTKWAFENIRLIIANTKARYISHYKTLELLGQGGMGKVHKAMDIHTRQIVALKVLHPDLLKDTENRKRLAAEGHILSSFHHPNIVRVLEVGESREQGFITMEFISGGTLKQLLNHAHPLPLTEIKRMLLQICAGIVEVHAHGIVHRDLKTGNMMLDAEGNIRIMDFGLSKTPLVTTMTSLGTVLGTLGYVAPEQVTNQHVDKRTDIFSLGVIIYELLTNTMPFKGENEIALIHSIFNITPLPPSSLRPDVTTEWDSLTAKCIAKNIADRFQSVEDVLQKVHLL